MSHSTESDRCCSDAAVAALNSILPLTEEFRTETLTEETIRRHLGVATQFAEVEGHPPDRVDDDYVVKRVSMQFTIHQPEMARLRGDESGHVTWLPERRADIFQRGGYWSNYRNMMIPRIAPRSLNRLDEIADAVLGDLEDPRRPGQWDRRGLVMGQVQSGKTGNYIGLICKAADAGYKLVIVLAGTHNNLRAQTQFRIDEGFTGRDTREGASSAINVGVGLADSPTVISLTSATDSGDFRAATAQQMNYKFGAVDAPTVFVVKKNATVLRNLQAWIASNAPRPLGHDRIANIPVLVIDDEADSASINTADHEKDPETDPSTINKLIRGLLNMFDQTGFVGYTATPFANIFIDNEPDNPDYGEDLFPRSFVYAITPPSNYMGPEQMFEISETDDLSEAPRSPLIVDSDDAEEWMPSRHKAYDPIPAALFPISLRRAIDSFVLSCAARRARDQGSEHMSMLIHVTRYVRPQHQVRDQVVDYLFDLKNEIQYGGDDGNPAIARLREIWEDDFIKASTTIEVSPGEGYWVHPFEEIEPELRKAVAAIEVRMINGSSTDALDYHKHDEEGLKTIVIGGAKLSRGLTLEGLSVSYYLRATRMYDTLMQMGRWFGYRPGYQDLCRIFTTPEISNWYRNIAIATRELLDEFAEMDAEGASPKDFGLKVRHSPGMLVTSATKMRNGHLQRVAFGDTRPEVTTFDTSIAARNKALNSLEEFIVDLDTNSLSDSKPTHFAWREVPAGSMIAYLRDLSSKNLYRNAKSAVPQYIADYMEDRTRKGGLLEWTVLLKSVDSQAGTYTLSGRSIGLATRSHQGSSATDTYVANSVIGSQDEKFDLDEHQIESANALAAEKGKKAFGRAFRRERNPANGLLIMYLLAGSGINGGDHLPDGPPYTAYCVSFPNDPTGTTVEYVVNNVYDIQ